MTVTLASNPSHLEAVDPVVEGATRAEQTDRIGSGGRPRPARRAADPHPRRRRVRRARASSPRRSTSQNLAGYSTGGTLHLIANNQVGFTTDPEEAARPATRATSRRASTSRSSTSTPTTPRPRSRRSGWRWPTAQRFAQRRRRRPRRLPALRPQRAGRARATRSRSWYKTIESHPSRARAVRRARSSRRASSPQEQAAELDEAVQSAMRQAHEHLKASIEAATSPQQKERRAARPRLRRPDRDGCRRRDASAS